MPSLTRDKPGPAYWRSLDEHANTPEFQEFLQAEFPTLAGELQRPSSRRRFLKLMGASLGLAGLTACRWPKEHIVPATRQPYDRIPGVPSHYATAFELNGVATGLLVTSYEGRPIKIEGNDLHPFSRGRTNSWMQAAILELYDPNRSQRVVQREDQAITPHRRWDEFDAFVSQHFDELRTSRGSRLCVLHENTSSPSFARMKAKFRAAFPEAELYEYEPISRDSEIEGARLAFGTPLRSHLHLDKADVIVSLDSDFLMTHPAAVKYAGDFAARRRPVDGKMSRFYTFEGGMSLTGSLADHRTAVRPSEIGVLVRQLARQLADELHVSDTPQWLAPAKSESSVDHKVIESLAHDLAAHRGRCAIVVGPNQPPEVHAIAQHLNAWLDAPGNTVSYTAEPDAERESHVANITRLVERMRAGNVDTLVMLGGNAVYDAPADLEFAGALEQVPTRIHLSLYDNETSQLCSWHAPRAHFLEAWGDARAWDGTLSICQPLIEPLYNGRTPTELLALITGDSTTDGHKITQATFNELVNGDETVWKQSLADGIVKDTAWATESATLAGFSPPTSDTSGEWDVVFTPDYSAFDGRFANNAWLQELPDPITKLTWDNAALISPADAAELGIDRNGQQIEITVGQRTLNVPVYMLPGHARKTITLPMGYARTTAGAVGDGVGFATHSLRTVDGMSIAGASVKLAGGFHELIGTQDHHAIKSEVGDAAMQGRIDDLAREGTLDEFKHHPNFAKHRVHHPPLESLWKEKDYDGHKWGMAIDLNACIGCGVCSLACQAENNIPVVGKDEVAVGREMHWIRIDRYFKGEPTAPNVEVVHQPVACVHCENAPCEQVCPVAATVHDEDGLNVMVYNRCIGTRYCANNCPYKVRRFNWFYNHHGPAHPRSKKHGTSPFPGKLAQAELTDVEKLANSPFVTVRSRGVMEKCTYCVQRINAVKIKAKNERWESIPDGMITPACAQACPASAITFGDLNDPNSAVRRLHEDDRAYAMLAELNVKPRTAYLAKLRNPANRDSHTDHGNEHT